MRAARALLAVLVLAAAGPAQDAPVARVPLVPDEQAPPVVAQFFASIRAGGSEPLNMHRAVANAPEAFVAYAGMARALRRDARVSRSIRELVILRTLQIEGGSYEFDQHAPMARSCGISDAQVASLADWRGSGLYDGRQRAALGWADAMATPSGPDDAAYAELARSFDPREIVELTLTAAFYTMSARTTKALAVGPDRRPASAGTYGAC